MKKPLLVLMALIVVLLAVPVRAACLLDTTLPVEFARSDAVFVATVTAARHVPPNDIFFDLDGDIYTVKVVETLRGERHKTIELFSENSSGRFPMVIGGKYILFAYGGSGSLSGRLMIDACGNSGLLPAASKTLAAVRSLATKNKPH
jgi:hypothetical protein